MVESEFGEFQREKRCRRSGHFHGSVLVALALFGGFVHIDRQQVRRSGISESVASWSTSLDESPRDCFTFALRFGISEVILS